MKLRSAAVALVVLALPVLGHAQQRLPSMPGYERYAEMAPRLADAQRSLATAVSWAEDSGSLVFVRNGARQRYDLATGQVTAAADDEGARGGRGGRPERGRQYAEAASPDGTRRAFYRDRNLWISDADGSAEVQVTTDGSEERRIKYGTASWVYGEELGQSTAMWWSPDGDRLAYYRFDESGVRDFYLQMSQTEIQSTLDVEAYPKAGTDNPVVDLFVYDLRRRSTTRIDARDGAPLSDEVVGHYVYAVEWSPDGSELLLNRTNRRQNVMELAACDPASGACRVVVREEWPASWTDNHPVRRPLADGHRFVWSSERSGWQNYYLYDLSGTLHATLTRHDGFEAAAVEHLDERRGYLYYTARSGDNHMKLQLHRVRLDGTGDERLTDPALTHAITFSPDGTHYVDVAQAHDRPPAATLHRADGSRVATLVEPDPESLAPLGLEPVEMFTFTAADGVTELHGMLHRPSDFDPSRRYPMLVSVYAGPSTNGARETFTLPHRFTELGFLVLTLDARSAGGRGKRFLDAIYQKLGVVEVDDLAAGVRSLWERPYVDASRVGIFGTSYGGYASALAILRHPDVFQAAVASSSVTDWRHYDTIYTERYMWTPQGNPGGYDAGSAMTYAADLRGRLLLYYGTADNNVHPNNTMQLIAALQEAGKSFDVQVGPDRGHSGIHPDRMMEFFIEHLVVAPAAGIVF